jgi:hypothetical protein
MQRLLSLAKTRAHEDAEVLEMRMEAIHAAHVAALEAHIRGGGGSSISISISISIRIR